MTTVETYMRLSKDWIKPGIALLVSLCGVAQGAEPVTITAEDMFNVIGQSYKAYANKSDVAVGGRLGTTGGPQAWDFSTGPTDDIYQFDYVAVNDGGNGAEFPKAKIAERKIEQSNGSKAWLYFEQIPGVGRMVYGAHEAKINADKPSLVFEPPVVDFPDTISYGDKWQTVMSYKTDFLTFDTEPDPDDPDAEPGTFTIPMIIETSSEFAVDAYGVLILPSIGFGNCLRVNELAVITVKVDLEGQGTYETVATEFVRTYYWLREDYGIAAQIVSKQQQTPPPDNFSLAAHFIRTFEANHPKGTSPPQVAIKDLKLSFGQGSVLLTWAKNATAKSYRVEYTSKPGGTEPWTKLEETTNNLVFDTTTPGVPMRFYRVIPVN
jgi:hypothetical protein